MARVSAKQQPNVESPTNIDKEAISAFRGLTIAIPAGGVLWAGIIGAAIAVL